jgi:predicted type IV restriction endonuclease
VKPLQDLVKRDANEGDTRLLVTDVLCDLLGYDKYSDLTTEYMIRGEFADYGIRIDGTMLAMVEVKRCTTKLSVRHLRQLEMYAVNEGTEWLVLTSGVAWQVYRLIPGMPVTIDLVLEVDLLSDSDSLAKKADGLVYLSREFLKRGKLDEIWQVTAATASDKLAEVMLSEAVLLEARRELRRRTGYVIDAGDLGRLVRDNVIRAEILAR